ncbi:GNAT family N-acetyltransferase [bacterium]|jgi:ribosomal protein S18 acetylase RimI-like enzyme|nr:GNAT family N-acetyltransferase [bacterium]
MDKITFREPKTSDVKSALEMINSLVEEKAYITVQKKLTLKEERAYFKNILKDAKKKMRIDLMLDINGEVCGSAGVWLLDDGIRKHVGEIGIALKKNARGKGLGEKLFKKTMEKAIKELNVKIVTLFVYKGNKVAINLYKKMGFKKLGVIKNGVSYYGKLIDNYLMIKYI